MRARNYRWIRFFMVIILFCIAFAAGFVVRGHSGFLASLGLPESITGIAENTPTEPSQTETVNNSLSKRVSEVENILKTDSLDEYSLDEVTEGTLTAFADATKDPYLRYYSSTRYEKLLNDKDESYAGIGVLFSEYNGQAYVVDVFEGSEAQLEGVAEGDFVVSVEGDNSQTWSRNEVTSVLSQSEGSSVVIEWRRPESLESDGGDEFKTSLTCRKYDEKNIRTDYDENRRVGYIKVRQLTQNSAALTQAAVTDLLKRGAGAFVLDLRDNPGGYLSQAVDIASVFMSSGTVVQVQTIDGTSAKPASGKPLSDKPLVVLINHNTAAGAEVIAAALKESRSAAELVGITTLGKGSVQVVSQLSFGGALRYTAAYYLTPEGHNIDQAGVTPTIARDESGEGDAQRTYAIELAGSMVAEAE